MASALDSSSSATLEANPEGASSKAPPDRGWLKVGLIAGASALAGGLAAAWFYRKTLAQLRQGEHSQDSEVKSSASGFEEDF